MHTASAQSADAQHKRDAVLVGLIGSGISLSRTPAMHEAEGARLGLRYIYNILDVDTFPTDQRDITTVFNAARICSFAGLNVTYPFKQAVLPLLDSLSEDAEGVGAVNTVVFRDGKAHGENTDLWGFRTGFEQNMADVKRDRVVQFGAGGAGTAVSRALIQCGVKTLFITDINHGMAQALAERINDGFGEKRAEAVVVDMLEAENLDGIVNTTPVGMAKLPGMAVPERLLASHLWVADIIYFPLETELLRRARTLGCKTLSGAPMAVYQAVKAFELFTGLKPDDKSMRDTFDRVAPQSGR